MKIVKSLMLALAFVAFGTSGVEAGFVIDNFSVAATAPQSDIFGNGVKRDFFLASSGTSGEISGGVLTGANATPVFNALPKVTLQYQSFPSMPAFTGIETFVTLGTVSNTSDNDLIVRGFKNSTSGAGLVDTKVIAQGQTANLIFKFADTVSWGGLLVSFSSSDSGESLGFSVSGPIVLSSVPEPASIALIGCTLVGGVVAGRRRRRNQALAV